jgi:hypothetical protein
MSAVAERTIMIEPQDSGSDLSVLITALALVLLASAAISFLGIRYLNWAIAPRRFWTRILFAGALPCAIVLGLMVALELSRGVGLPWAITNLSRIPTEGRLVMTGMLAMGLGLSWLVARRHDKRLRLRAENDLGVFR